MQLNPPQYHAKYFHHIKDEKKLVSEYSDLQLKDFHQLYDDACDVGIALYNPKTGSVTRWYWADDERDREGDIMLSKLLPCKESIRKYPALEGYTMIIFND